MEFRYVLPNTLPSDANAPLDAVDEQPLASDVPRGDGEYIVSRIFARAIDSQRGPWIVLAIILNAAGLRYGLAVFH